ncbi:hypothetical protein PQR52_07840 [Paraburkholderia aspalathi]|jgi:hypothetical protein
MEDTSENEGALAYYPGSRELPIYLNEYIGVCCVEQQQSEGHYPQLGAR